MAVLHENSVQIIRGSLKNSADLNIVRNQSEKSSIPSSPIFNPADLEREIRKLRPRTSPSIDLDVYDDNISIEDRLRLGALQQILNDPLGGERHQLLGSLRMITRLGALKETAPHFGEFIDLVARAVMLSYATNTPLRLPPIMLVGAPGLGKTYMARRLANSLETKSAEIAVNMIDTFRLRGTNSGWKGAKMGKIASTLIESRTTSPIIILDEFDKPSPLHQQENAHDIYHSLLEEENSRNFVDDYLEFPLQAHRIIWIASANDQTSIPRTILDRFLVLPIRKPDIEHLSAVIKNMYATANERYANCFSSDLSSEIIEYLARHNPRRIGRLLDLSLARAVSEGRFALQPRDLESSEHLLPEHFEKVPIGFRTA